LKDSLTGEDKFNTINELEGKYQSELKEAQIKDLAQQQEIDALRIRGLGLGIAAAGLVLLLILFFYRQSTLRNRQKAIETELRLNRARMDPHFFFNAMGSIQTLAIKEGSFKTSDFLGKFARIMRHSLESTYQEQVTLEKEVEFLQRYLDLQKMRFPGKFTYTLNLDPELDPEAYTLPSMILQPFVENAIEHGFKAIDYPGEIQVRFWTTEHSLEIEVEDNGKFFKDETKHKEYPSRATQIIRDRLYLLQKQTHRPASFEIRQGSAQMGYLISIHLPLIPAKP
jgi:LytS/YehU family sensor histidine kinase